MWALFWLLVVIIAAVLCYDKRVFGKHAGRRQGRFAVCLKFYPFSITCHAMFDAYFYFFVSLLFPETKILSQL